MSSGWISIYREIKDHWIWSNPVKFQWWINILLSVNHTPKKVNIGNNLIDCDNGQSVRSLGSWANEFNTTKKTIKTFFELLQNDDMIRIENMKFTTRITVCNYDSYQNIVNGMETVSKRKLPTNNNDNKEIKDLYTELTPFVSEFGKEMIREFFDYWTEEDKKGKQRWQLEKTWSTKSRLSRWNKNNFGGKNETTKLYKGFKLLTDEEKERKQVPKKWDYIHYKNTYKRVHVNGQGNYIEDNNQKIYI